MPWVEIGACIGVFVFIGSGLGFLHKQVKCKQSIVLCDERTDHIKEWREEKEKDLAKGDDKFTQIMKTQHVFDLRLVKIESYVGYLARQGGYKDDTATVFPPTVSEEKEHD